MGTHRPVSGYKYQVYAPDKLAGICGFSRVTGLEAETEVVEYREGCDPLTKSKYPGLSNFPPVVLEKGVSTDAKAMVNWYQKSVSDPYHGFGGLPNPQHRADVQIRLLDREGVLTTTFKLRNAWPMRLQYDDLDASSSDILIHRLELVHEGLEIT